MRVALLRELAQSRESLALDTPRSPKANPSQGDGRAKHDAASQGLVATHLSFPSVCHVAIDGDAFRWVPGSWEY